MQGNLDEIERAFEEGAIPSEVMALPETPFEFYSLAHRERQRKNLSLEGLLTLPEPTAVDLILARRQEENRERQQTILKKKPVKAKKIGRNDPCPCGSGRKYKKCCL